MNGRWLRYDTGEVAIKDINEALIDSIISFFPHITHLTFKFVSNYGNLIPIYFLLNSSNDFLTNRKHNTRKHSRMMRTHRTCGGRH